MRLRPTPPAEAREVRAAAHRLGIALVERSIHTQEEAQATLAAVQPGEVDGVLVPRCCALNIPVSSWTR